MNEAFGNQYHQKFYNQLSQSGLGIENLLPYLPKHMFNGITQNADFEDRNKVKLKARQSMGISNIAKP